MKKILLNLFIIFTFLFSFVNGVFAQYFGPVWASYPIKVYIPAGTTYSSYMTQAFQKWQTKSNNRIGFTFVDIDDAQIIVNFADEVDGSDGEIGSYDVSVKGGNIVGARINIINNSEKKYSNDLIFTVMLHEIGHVLGLPDSNRNLGIMHSPVNENQDLIPNDIVRLFRFNGWSVINSGGGIK